MTNYISESEYMYLTEADFDEGNDLYSMYDIKQDRKMRISSLVGRYLVACDGKKSGKQVYLQDKTISKGGYWTQFISNAKGFKTKSDAIRNKNTFKYGNPRVYLMDNNKCLVEIK